MMDLVSRANALTLSVHLGGYLTLLQEQGSLGSALIFTNSCAVLCTFDPAHKKWQSKTNFQTNMHKGLEACL